MPESFTRQHNRLLAALPPDAQARVFPYLERVSLSPGEVLHEPDDSVAQVYFPEDCIVSLMHASDKGAPMEIAMVGNDGLVGIAVFMGGDSTSSRAIVRSSGSACRLPTTRLMAEFDRYEQLTKLLLRYTQALITQMAQTAVCNRHHAIEQQLSRWLLVSLDRLPTNHLSTTQGMIANMLGVRREGVTEAARKLQKLGVIEYSRGQITVLDRLRLESLSCECYAVVKRECDRLLPRQCSPLADRRAAAG